MRGVRPKREDAQRSVREFLAEEVSEEAAQRFDAVHDWRLITDGDDGYAFFLIPSDPTSYVHHSLHIEWHGTCWPDGECSECGTDFSGGEPEFCPDCEAPTAFAGRRQLTEGSAT